ncbi:hypothetical protein JST97_26280 [bacterium]|nr:hypothetical protein [bacterium]
MQANISNIRMGTANTFEHLASGFKQRVIGDGRVEPELADQFKGAGFVEDISDRRLRQFLRGHHELRQEKRSFEENQRLTSEALAETLGKGWSIDALYGPGAEQKGNGISRVQLKYEEAGVGNQVLNLQHYEGSEISLSTSCPSGRWQVTHSVEGRLKGGELDPQSLVERASFSNPSIQG